MTRLTMLKTIFSHKSMSNHTARASSGQLTMYSILPRSIAERKRDARSAVKGPNLTGRYVATILPASSLEKSSKEFTRVSKRWAFLLTTFNRSRASEGRLDSASTSCKGPRMRVKGVLQASKGKSSRSQIRKMGRQGKRGILT